MKPELSFLFFAFLLIQSSSAQNGFERLESFPEVTASPEATESYNLLTPDSVSASISENREYLRAALQRAKENSREQAAALYHLGLHFREEAEFDSSYLYFSLALSLAEKNQFKDILPNIHNGLGTVWYKRSDFSKALEHYRKAVEIGREGGDEKANTSRLLNIGRIYYYHGDLNQALLYFQKAGENSETFGDDLGNAHACKEIGKIYNQWQQYPEARTYYQKALQIYEKLKDNKQISIILNELGIIYRNEKDYQKAIELQQKSLEIKEKIGYKYGIASSLNGLGITCKTMQQYPKALEYYQRALQIQQEINDEMGIAATMSNIGIVHQKLGQFDSALQSFLSSIEKARQIQYNQLIINNLTAISDIYSDQKDFARSLDYLKQAIVIKDSLFNQEKHKQFAEMQTKYETVRKEKENEQLKYELDLNYLKIARQETQRNLLIVIIFIILVSSLLVFVLYRLRTKAFHALSEANAVILRQKQELELLNKTRDRFFSIISHDLRNALGSALMGIELLENGEELEKEEMSLVLSELKSSINGLSNLLENLLGWARIQIGRIHPEPVRFNLAEALEEVLVTLKSKFIQKKIHFISEISDSTTVFADRNMVSSILQNLLSNAVKFTPENGEIRISEKKDDKNIEISISDNGVGIDSAKLEKLFRVDEFVSTPGTKSEKGTGLGLILCREFVEKNGGTIGVVSQPQQGTTVHFTLPPAEN